MWNTASSAHLRFNGMSCLRTSCVKAASGASPRITCSALGHYPLSKGGLAGRNAKRSISSLPQTYGPPGFVPGVASSSSFSQRSHRRLHITSTSTAKEEAQPYTDYSPDATADSGDEDESEESEVVLARLHGTLLYLSDLGVNVKRALKRYPNLKNVDVETVQEFKRNCNELFHLGDAALAKVITLYPYTINAERLDMEKMVNYFMDVGIPRSGVAMMVERHPQLIHYNLEQNVKPTMSYLRDDLGITGSHLVKMMMRQPKSLSYSLEYKLKPLAEFFIENGIEEEKIGKIVRRCPEVIGLSIPNNLQTTVKWLLDLGIEPGIQGVGGLIVKWPKILAMSERDNLTPTVNKFYRLGISKESLAKAVSEFPQILSFSVEANIAPKVEFLVRMMGKDPAEVLATCPRFYSYSLLKRIRPRWAFLKSRQLEGEKHLTAWLACSDDDFAKRVIKCNPEEWNSFRESEIQRYEIEKSYTEQLSTRDRQRESQDDSVPEWVYTWYTDK